MRGLRAAVCVGVFLFAASPLAAEPVVNTFKVSAKVASLTAGKSYPFTFRLFDAAQGGNKLFEEIKSYKVPTSKTIAHLLGSVSGDPTLNPLEARHFLQQVWVEVSTPSKPPFPRIMLGPAPLALGCQNADMIDGLHASELGGTGSALVADFLDGHDSTAFFLLSDNVTVTGIPAFNGGQAGEAPFTVGSSGTVTNLNADLLDGNEASAFQKKYDRVAVVAKSGGDYTSPLAAMADRSSWCTPNPYAGAPCLLKIMPGVYDIEGGTLVMQEWVDIEGSGELATVITGTASTDAFPPGVVLQGANNAEVRFLSVKNTGANFICAIANLSASPRMTFVTAEASGPVRAYGVRNDTAAPAMTNLTVKATGGLYGYGINNVNSAPTMTNVTVSGTGATIGIGVYNSGVLQNALSPTMTSVTASGAGGATSNYGVYNRDCSPVMREVTASATGTMSMGMGNIVNAGTHQVLADRCTFSGSTTSISNFAGYTVRLSSSKLVGPANVAGTYNCVGVTKVDGATGAYSAADGVCQ